MTSDKIKPVAGLTAGIPFEDYVRIDAVNQSVLGRMSKSAAHARAYMVEPPDSTKEQHRGLAGHVAVLEPKDFGNRYSACPPCDKRTKEGKSIWEAFQREAGVRTVLTRAEWDMAQSISKAVREHPAASRLLGAKGTSELTAVWKDDATGLTCKGRIDRVAVIDGEPWLLDLKTTRDASPFKFSRAVAEYGYHRQAAFYIDGARALGSAVSKFAFIAIEKEPPFAVAVYELDPASIEQGRMECAALLRKYKACVESGIWPGYSAKVEPLRIPEWAFKGVEQLEETGEEVFGD